MSDWNPQRSVICTCGWGSIFPTLRAANAAIAVHMKEGTEGCDHAVDIEVHIPKEG